MILAKTDLTGVAALITAAATGVATLIGVARAQNKAGEARQEARHEAEKVDIKVSNEIDRRARNEGALDALRGSIDSLQGQVVEISRDTAKQLAASTEALVACERRHTDKDSVIHELRDEVRALSAKVGDIEQIVGAGA